MTLAGVLLRIPCGCCGSDPAKVERCPDCTSLQVAALATPLHTQVNRDGMNEDDAVRAHWAAHQHDMNQGGNQ